MNNNFDELNRLDDVKFLKGIWKLPMPELEELLKYLNEKYKYDIKLGRSLKGPTRLLYKRGEDNNKSRMKFVKDVMLEKKRNHPIPDWVDEKIELLSRRKLANMIESYAAIVSIPDVDVKGYAKAAIRDMFIQRPSRSITYENWPGFKNYVVEFFGEDSYNTAMDELQKEQFISKGKTRYEWRKDYSPVGTLPEKKSYINEWADRAVVNGKELDWSAPGAYAFGYDDYTHQFRLSSESGVHGSINATDYDDNFPRGRYWTKEKIMAFWVYPKDKKAMNELVKSINYTAGKNIIDSSWKVEIPMQNANILNIYGKANINRKNAELIPIGDFDSDVIKNPIEWKVKSQQKMQQHMMSPMAKNSDVSDDIGSRKRMQGLTATQLHQQRATSDGVVKLKPLMESFQPDSYKQYIPKLVKFMVEQGMKITPLPKIKIISNNEKNSESILGKTAYYDKDLKEITLFTLNRHPKDILRSLSHEMIHHEQNLDGRLGNIATTNTNEDSNLESLEKEAYEKGNIMLRNWEDSIKNKKPKKKLNEYKTDFGCLMVQVKFPGWERFVTSFVKKEDVYDNTAHEYGYETEPHVTILYGFHDDTDLNKIKKILDPIHNDIRIITNKISVFETKIYDVVKFEIHSVLLTKLNKIMRENFDYTSNFDSYNAHMTIAYVKPGTGKKYVKDLSKTLTFLCDTFMYSYPGGEKEEFSIKKSE